MKNCFGRAIFNSSSKDQSSSYVQPSIFFKAMQNVNYLENCKNECLSFVNINISKRKSTNQLMMFNQKKESTN